MDGTFPQTAPGLLFSWSALMADTPDYPPPSFLILFSSPPHYLIYLSLPSFNFFFSRFSLFLSFSLSVTLINRGFKLLSDPGKLLLLKREMLKRMSGRSEIDEKGQEKVIYSPLYVSWDGYVYYYTLILLYYNILKKDWWKTSGLLRSQWIMIMIRCDENLYSLIKNCTNNALIEVKGFFAQKKRFKIDI